MQPDPIGPLASVDCTMASANAPSAITPESLEIVVDLLQLIVEIFFSS